MQQALHNKSGADSIPAERMLEGGGDCGGTGTRVHLSAPAAGTLLPCHTRSPWYRGAALAACHRLDDDYLHWGLEDARASLVIGAELLQPKDAKSGVGTAGALAVAGHILVTGAGGTSNAAPPRAFLATVPLLRHDKVMSAWSGDLLITAGEGVCGAVRDLWLCMRRVNSSHAGVGCSGTPSDVVSKT